MTRKLTVIDSLTSLRFFAALGVFLHHLGILNNSDSPFVKTLARYFFNGYSGVTFFYILSGFIISYSFNRHKISGEYDSKDFIVFRISRLFPVHLLTLATFIYTFNIIDIPQGVATAKLLSNIFLVQAIIPIQDYYFAFNPVSWSISCELLFYIAFVFLVRFRTKYLIAFLTISLLLNVFFAASPIGYFSSHWFLYINPFFRLSDFIIGMLFCRWFLASNFQPSVRMCSVFEVLSLFSLILTVYVATNYIHNMNFKYDLLFIPCMFLIVATFSFNNGVVSRFLSNKFLKFLGESSFSFYMIHFIFVSKLNELLLPSPNNTKELVTYILIAFICSLLSSMLMFKLFELPINKFIRNKWVSFRYSKSLTVVK